jgi:hypothetical protein
MAGEQSCLTICRGYAKGSEVGWPCEKATIPVKKYTIRALMVFIAGDELLQKTKQHLFFLFFPFMR